eukprot:scaffold8751_cov98-Isochrysis_galbana.AAC.2
MWPTWAAEQALASRSGERRRCRDVPFPSSPSRAAGPQADPPPPPTPPKGEGTLPDGISAPAIRDAVNEAYKALPVKPYACEPTRTNDGVCYTPGANADDAYKCAPHLGNPRRARGGFRGAGARAGSVGRRSRGTQPG